MRNTGRARGHGDKFHALFFEDFFDDIAEKSAGCWPIIKQK
jgi:hypothetical protein